MTAIFFGLIDNLRQSRLTSYNSSPGDIEEHFGIEEQVLAGGYGYRQITELVQNGADAILEAQDSTCYLSDKNRIEVVLKNSTLYVAINNSDLKERIDELLASYWFGYVAGFINTSKHRKLVKHDFHLSLVDNVAGIQIGAFEYGGRKYPTYFAPDLLLGILEVKNQVIACGSALNIHCIQPMPNNSGSDVDK